MAMAKIYFICGFIGSGKTTYAKQLAISDPAVRFSIDEWMIPLYGEHMEREVFDTRLQTLMALFKDTAADMLNLGTSVIFDFGFWAINERVEFQQWAESIGVESELIYLDSSFEVCSKRALTRNQNRSDKSYEMTPDMLSMFWSWFEIPSIEEGVTTV
jgi:predicted kinase